MNSSNDLSKKKIIFWEDQGLLQYSLSYWLQKKINCKMFAIFDITDRTKSFFENQQLVKFQNIWFLHDHILKNKKPDLEYLKYIENEYDLPIWLIAAPERIFYGFYNYHKFSEDEILSIIEQECKLFEQILDDVRPDFLIINPNMQQNHIFMKICEKRKIKILLMTSPRIGPRIIVSHDLDVLPDYYEKSDPKKILSFSELQLLNKKFSLYDETNKYVEGFSNSKLDLFKTALEYLLISKNSNEKTHFTYYGRTKLKVLINSFVDKIKIKYRMNFIENSFIKSVPQENFIFFPLHIEPERTLLIDAPFFINQLELIHNISKSLPIGYKLFVKEHPAMITRNWRSINYYKKLQNMPNVKLLHPSIKPEDILQKCSLVITINGTAGFDSLLYEKPSIVFADPIYSTLSSVVKVKDITKLPTTIRETLEKKVDLVELNNFINLMEKNSLNFKWNSFQTKIQKVFYKNGNLLDVEISENQMEKFLKDTEEIIAPLVDEHIKRINQYLE